MIRMNEYVIIKFLILKIHLTIHLILPTFKKENSEYSSSLQEFKQNYPRVSCNISNYCTNFREKQVMEKDLKKMKSQHETVTKKMEKLKILWYSASRTAVRRRIKS